MTDNVDRLEGSAPMSGGLVIRKKKPAEESQSPRVSLLGLDKLAGNLHLIEFFSKAVGLFLIFLPVDEKRKLKEALELDLKESSESKQSNDGFLKPSLKTDKKAYRISNETPTYTGGVSKEARERVEERHIRDRQRGVHASTSKVIYYFK